MNFLIFSYIIEFNIKTKIRINKDFIPFITNCKIV